MNTPNQSDSQSNLSRILEKIHEIVEKSADGDYIYRGEPECYGKASSGLYREYEDDIESENFDITVVQKEILDKAREYIGEAVSDFEILTELQHRGGTTNLIDFTTDCHIALFFACDGSHGKPGRVILLEKESEDYKIEKASKTINRAESQKSIFVQSDTGFIELGQCKVICIPSDLKTYVLDYLQKHHDISTRTIYNDLQGFIENQRIHQSAYTEFYRGLTCQKRGNEAETLEEKHEHYESAVKCYAETLKLNPQMFMAYYNRGLVYCQKGEGGYDRAIQDFGKVIEIKSNYSKAYYNRGLVYGEKGEYAKAIQDFSMAIKSNPDYTATYYCRGLAYLIKGKYDEALQDFNRAIELKPDEAEAYSNRGLAYSAKSEYDKAVQDFNKAIELEPEDAMVYSNRGEAWLHLKEWEKARADLTVAKNNGYDTIASFHNDYESVEDFEQKNNVQLPEDIAAMLRRQ